MTINVGGLDDLANAEASKTESACEALSTSALLSRLEKLDLEQPLRQSRRLVEKANASRDVWKRFGPKADLIDAGRCMARV